MKRNKFMEFLNDKGKYAAVFAFIVVAGICAGTAAYNKGVKNDSAEKNNTVSEPVLARQGTRCAGDHQLRLLRAQAPHAF